MVGIPSCVSCYSPPTSLGTSRWGWPVRLPKCSAAGHAVRCLDLSLDPLDEEAVAWAQLVGISTPMHTATRLGVRVR